MKKGRFTKKQIIGMLKQHEAGRKVPELAREIEDFFAQFEYCG